MKRIIMVVFLLMIIILAPGCGNSYKPITYTKFNEVFKNNSDYLVINQTLKYQDKFERCLEATGKNITIVYYEFKTEEQARQYMIDNYKGRKKYRFSSGKTYTKAKCTSHMYFKAIQTDKMVIAAQTPNKKNKKEIKKILKELGF